MPYHAYSTVPPLTWQLGEPDLPHGVEANTRALIQDLQKVTAQRIEENKAKLPSAPLPSADDSEQQTLLEVLERLKSCDPSLNHVALDSTVPGNSLHAVVDAQALAAGIKVCPQLTKLDLRG